MTIDATMPQNFVQSLDNVIQRINELRTLQGLKWREISKYYGLPAGTLSSIAKGREPKDPHTRALLNLPVLAPTPVCPGCGIVHIKPTCPRKRKPRIASNLEASFSFLIRVSELPEPVTEYKFHKTRKWRFDFAYPDRMIAVEVEGGIYGNGRHNRPVGFENDCEKYNEAQLLGWKVYRFTGAMIRDGRALETMISALEVRA
jgi:hypothetical protein